MKDLDLIQDADLRDAEVFGLLMDPVECDYYAKKTAMSKSQKVLVESQMKISKHNKTIWKAVHCSTVYNSKMKKIMNIHQYETG